MVVIRLSRVGKRNSPAYRVVVAEKRRAVKRKFIEVIGHYNPTLKPKEIVINADRASFWLGYGAQPSDTVRNLMVDLGILKKSDRINIKYAKNKKKKELKAEKEKGEKEQSETKTEKTDESADESQKNSKETKTAEDAKKIKKDDKDEEKKQKEAEKKPEKEKKKKSDTTVKKSIKKLHKTT